MYEALRRSIAQYVALTDAEFALLVSHFTRRRLRKREPLLAPGERHSIEGFVETGCLRVYFSDRKGIEHVLHFVPENRWIVDIGGVAPRRLPIFGVDALEHSDVLVIDRQRRDVLFAASPKFERLWWLLQQRIYLSLQQRLIAGMCESVEQRYLDFRRDYVDLERRLPQHQIAAYLGISPEFLSRIRGNLARRHRVAI